MAFLEQLTPLRIGDLAPWAIAANVLSSVVSWDMQWKQNKNSFVIFNSFFY